jgi:hypothetical protein
MTRSLGQFAACLLAFATSNALAADNWALDTFCTEVQRVTAQTGVRSNLTIHETSWDYRYSKPGIDPVEIHQYVTPDATGRPKMISCKVKAVDHLKSAYGPKAAGTQGTCEQVTRSVVEQARARAGSPSVQVRIDPEEQVWTGSSYLAPFELVTRDAAGVLHVHTRFMRIDWDDWRWYVMPNKVRGHLYCHVIAPEYMARIFRGESPELQPIEVPPEPDGE